MFLSRRSVLAATTTFLPLPFAAACTAPRAHSGSSTTAAPRKLRVGFAISEGFNVMDMAGPWETFQDVVVRDEMACELTTVAGSHALVEGTGGMRVEARWSYADAPQFDVIVVGAQKGGPALHEWLRAQAKGARVIMSVCTGAFQLARAGLLHGRSATTHHDYYDAFEREFTHVKLVRGPRFVDEGSVCSAGGITSGVHLAIHVVARIFGEDVANATARELEFVPTERPT
ncbi:DJ-1/PfpI family protein [Pendulispora brunnea]|uniref:DJ-1/PfpI family protein n=1 Tax=Pendulispora brunnea TaxID=2905690 RepID=A0ABZ2K0G8_9BACT